MNRPIRIFRFSALLVSIMVALTLAAQAATETVLYSFQGPPGDGGWPEAGVRFDTAGNLYGTTRNFGPNGYGIVYQLAPSGDSWAETVIHAFCSDYPECSDGAYPIAGVVFDAAGNLYGTTSYGGGAQSWGTVFQLTPSNGSWTEEVLCELSCLGDSYPSAEVTFDKAGHLFASVAGNPVFGGLGDVLELASDSGGGWRHRILYSFRFNNDGHTPSTALAIDKQHNLYGMTIIGGAYDFGTVFEISPRAGGRWAEKTLHDFTYAGTVGGLTFNKEGELFGTAHGEFFQLTHAGGEWVYTTLYAFSANEGGHLSRLTIDRDGNFWGTARIGGKPGCANAYGCGSVFKFTRTEEGWQKSTIYEFRGQEDGGNPVGGVVLDERGNLYGATNWGGLNNCDGLTCGVVYKITP